MTQSLEIALFPCLSDNYGFLIHDPESGETAAIDTPEASKIEVACAERGWALTQIWNTHHHPDQGIRWITLFTMSHPQNLFSWETRFLFWAAGDYLKVRPKICLADTKIYCAHEYTLSNAKFAVTIEPNNQDLLDYVEKAKVLRKDNIPTVPTTIRAEKACNPFIRAATAQRLGEIRAAKDNSITAYNALNCQRDSWNYSLCLAAGELTRIHLWPIRHIMKLILDGTRVFALANDTVDNGHH